MRKSIVKLRQSSNAVEATLRVGEVQHLPDLRQSIDVEVGGLVVIVSLNEEAQKVHSVIVSFPADKKWRIQHGYE